MSALQDVSTDWKAEADLWQKRAEAERARANRIQGDLENLEQVERGRLREIGRLKAELRQKAEDDPDAQSVKRICAEWKLMLGHPKAKTPLGGKRALAVKARLKHFTEEQLIQAIHGCAKMPFVGAGGRKPIGSPKERHDDLELIMRDETTVERFIRYAGPEGNADVSWVQIVTLRDRIRELEEVIASDTCKLLELGVDPSQLSEANQGRAT